MISIESRGAHFSIKISEPGSGFRAYRVPAVSVEECMQAVEHYYAIGTHLQPGKPDCPLCQTRSQS